MKPTLALSVKEIFSAIEKEKDIKCEIKLSYLELYNEMINDLLDTKKKNLEIRENSQKVIFVEGLTEVNIDSYDKVLNCIKQGDSVKIMAETKQNENSSRSHTIFRMIVETTKKVDGKNKSFSAQINLVDLAGSENVSKSKTEGIRLKEGSNINKSLLALSIVINKLSSNPKS
jgi:centromeric protein E